MAQKKWDLLGGIPWWYYWDIKCLYCNIICSRPCFFSINFEQSDQLIHITCKYIEHVEIFNAYEILMI